IGEFAGNDGSESWCRNHFVRSKTLGEIRLLREQLGNLLRENIENFADFRFQDKLEKPTERQVFYIKYMVAGGFIDQVAIRADKPPTPPDLERAPTRAIDVPYLTLQPPGGRQLHEDRCVYIHPTSPMAHLSARECPDYIVYARLQGQSSSVPGDKGT